MLGWPALAAIRLDDKRIYTSDLLNTLAWEAGADQYGSYIDKHKDSTGKEIRLKVMKMKESGTGNMVSLIGDICDTVNTTKSR